MYDTPVLTIELGLRGGVSTLFTCVFQEPGMFGADIAPQCRRKYDAFAVASCALSLATCFNSLQFRVSVPALARTEY